MKRLSLLLSLAVLGLLVAVPAVQAAPSSVFTGEWTATDTNGDNSTLHLFVGPGPHPMIWYSDEVASQACADFDNQYFTSKLTGTYDGSTLSGQFVVIKCGPVTTGRRDHGDFRLTWWPIDGGMLEDNFGEIWHRV